jgi:hypothetical protein
VKKLEEEEEEEEERWCKEVEAQGNILIMP